MAKFGAGFVGIFTLFLVIYSINLCATNPIEENDKKPIVDIKNQYQSVQTTNSSTAAATAAVAQQQNANGSTSVSATDKAADVSTSSVQVPPSSRPLLGVNGTGQRKDMTDKIGTTTAATAVPTDITKSADATSSDEAKKNANQFPKKVLSATKVAATGVAATVAGTIAAATGPVTGSTNSTEETDLEKLIDTIDVPEEDTLESLKKTNRTLDTTSDHHQYYNSTTYTDKDKADKYWNDIKNITPNWMLSQSHRRAMTVLLSFDFPFYGHPVRNVTVATGGFIYTGDYVHSWLAATQYIAPLMANFDTSLSNDSFVRLNDTGSSFTVIWENVSLQDKQDVGKFTFSATLHKNGDIVFTYYKVPIFINAIQDDKHPVKVGLSDAYIMDQDVGNARRKTIYEYHRVSFGNAQITNATIIYFTALPTCLQYTDCASCLNHNTDFTCFWCPTANRCSTGTDRKRQEWKTLSCERFQIVTASTCPAAGSNNTHTDGNTNTNHKDVTTHPFKPYNPSGLESSTTTAPVDSGNTEYQYNGTQMKPLAGTQMKSMAEEAEPSQKMSLTLGLFIPICLVSCVLLWVLYAYRNPHTKSGQLLIQYRPSQWSWRRGEARYTAATIHM
ncbi:plexin domain-containing protein 1 isoform X2 [Musca domestica]|uniref:Plexin domain-containing protein 1 isoform X2 n=1 Tax=Musca domestica TaxID=7370 RepID=A0ABM3UZQ6_MUSDO|nr:plexin domain-containing protein 1 isoform X2 [Musca domestica]